MPPETPYDALRVGADGAGEGSEERFLLAFEHAPIGMTIVAPDGRLLEVNPALCRMLGYDAAELARRTFQELTHPDDLDADLELFGRLHAGEIDDYALEKRYLHADGHVVWARLHVASVRDGAGGVRYLLSQVQDVTDHRREYDFRLHLLELVDAALQGGLDESFYQRVVDAAVAAIPGAQAGSLLLRDGDDSDRFRFAAATGYDFEALRRVYLREEELYQDPSATGPHLVFDTGPQELEDERASELWEEGADIAVTLAIPLVVDGRRVGYFNLDNRDARDAFPPASIEMARLFAAQVGMLMTRLALEAELRHQAFHDPLTGLVTRRLLYDRIERAMAQTVRTERALALLMLDLDDFKRVNDRHGHGVGDALLVQVAERLGSVVRESDTAARLGGDEFVLLLTDLSSPPDGRLVAERVGAALRGPCQVAGRLLETSISIGVALHPGSATSPRALLEQADTALYRAKARGKDGYAVFGDEGSDS